MQAQNVDNSLKISAIPCRTTRSAEKRPAAGDTASGSSPAAALRSRRSRVFAAGGSALHEAAENGWAGGPHCEAQNYDSKTGWHGGSPGANHHEPTPGTTATGAKRPPQRAGKEEAKPGTEAGRKASEAQPAARAAAAEPQEPEPPPENGADGDTPGGQGPGRKETKQPPAAATDRTKASERAAKAARPTAGPKPAEPTAHTDSPAVGETHPPRAGADTAPGAPKAARHTADTPDTQPTATAGRDGRAASAAQKEAAADTQAARPHEQGPGEQEQERGPDTPTSGKAAARATGEEGADTAGGRLRGGRNPARQPGRRRKQGRGAEHQQEHPRGAQQPKRNTSRPRAHQKRSDGSETARAAERNARGHRRPATKQGGKGGQKSGLTARHTRPERERGERGKRLHD